MFFFIVSILVILFLYICIHLSSDSNPTSTKSKSVNSADKVKVENNSISYSDKLQTKISSNNSVVVNSITNQYQLDQQLNEAIKSNNFILAKELISAGADVNNMENHFGGSLPLTIAAQYGSLEMCVLLIKEGADIDKCPKFTGEIIQSPDSIVADYDYSKGNSALILATLHNRFDIVELLIRSGGDINITNFAGNSPLIVASMHGHSQLVDFFVKHGADIEIKNIYSQTALFSACCKNNNEIIKLLINNGANRNVTDTDGDNCIDMVRSNGNIVGENLLAEMKSYLIKRIDGVKYLEIDNCKSIIHACSSVENYFDKYLELGYGDMVEKAETFVNELNVSKKILSYETVECCFCGYLNKTNALLPNSSCEIRCLNCKENLLFYTLQMTSCLEERLGMQNSGGRAIIWLSTPSNNPEFKELLNFTNISIGTPIRLYTGRGAAPWWYVYEKTTI